LVVWRDDDFPMGFCVADGFIAYGHEARCTLHLGKANTSNIKTPGGRWHCGDL
jgi:hypothetical protein